MFTFYFSSVFIISLVKWILFLNSLVYNVNYSSVRFTRAETTLLFPIQWKADAKLLKQQLLDDFWWYFISGASGWNYTFLIIFALPIGTPHIRYVFLLSTLNLVWYSFYRNLVNVSWIFLLTNHDQDRTKVLFLMIVLGSYIFCLIFFLFII